MPGIDPRALLSGARRGRAGRCADVRVGWCRPRVARAAGFSVQGVSQQVQSTSECGQFGVVSQYGAKHDRPIRSNMHGSASSGTALAGGAAEYMDHSLCPTQLPTSPKL